MVNALFGNHAMVALLGRSNVQLADVMTALAQRDQGLASRLSAFLTDVSLRCSFLVRASYGDAAVSGWTLDRGFIEQADALIAAVGEALGDGAAGELDAIAALLPSLAGRSYADLAAMLSTGAARAN